MLIVGKTDGRCPTILVSLFQVSNIDFIISLYVFVKSIIIYLQFIAIRHAVYDK